MAIDKIGSETLDTMSEAKAYNSRLFSLIKPWLRGKVLEVGAGIGTFIEKVRDNGFKVSALDINPEYITHLKKRFKGISTYLVDLQMKKLPPTLMGAYETVIMSNVLEHIENDTQALANVNNILKKGGYLILIVPAHQWAYGKMDEGLGHFRRYSLAQTTKLLENNGFDIIKARYINSIQLVGWWLVGKVLKRKKLSPGSIKLTEALFPIIEFVDERMKLPFGLSVYCVAQKK